MSAVVGTPGAAAAVPVAPAMVAVRMRLHAQHQAVAVMRRDSYVCLAEGLASRSQVLVRAGERELLAQLYQIEDDERLAPEQVALSEDAWDALGLHAGDTVEVRHPPLLDSLAGVRKRIYGQRLNMQDMTAIVGDVVKGRYTDVHLAAFLTATSTLPLDEQETVDLTRAMVQVGERLKWGAQMVVDKHCVGGLPGNRTTPIVVAIVTANGLLMPKTSSRAITSPAGTADTMETLAPVDLSLDKLRDVVKREGGCLAWGGSMHLSPADDIFVRVERELDIDTEGQLIASVLSKKIAAGATHVVIDIPVGPTAKVRSQEAAQLLGSKLTATATYFGLAVHCLYTDGTQPVGRGIGPALEARDVLAVLRNDEGAPADLRQRAAVVAGAVLEMGGAAPAGGGMALALRTLDEGLAWEKFQRICDAQGGMREPPRAPCVLPLVAASAGKVVGIDNRKLSRLAKLAGAPDNPAAGVDLRVQVGDRVVPGAPLLFLHAQTPSTLDYALIYARGAGDIIEIAT
ncbi:thymidine phosphorylase family protein [Serratia marcescens]|uniref:thymidine phosphorylase family protein n=3 Tax=Pseudomonadota TaxID=1224 RepID=UPI000AD943E4|nr:MULTISPECIES: thymidine phosphorylase family protein [Pseudomonadota]MDX7489080.1 thymidine phosphorylase family protein [Serratia marcescens]